MKKKKSKKANDSYGSDGDSDSDKKKADKNPKKGQAMSLKDRIALDKAKKPKKDDSYGDDNDSQSSDDKKKPAHSLKMKQREDKNIGLKKVHKKKPTPPPSSSSEDAYEAVDEGDDYIGDSDTEEAPEKQERKFKAYSESSSEEVFKPLKKQMTLKDKIAAEKAKSKNK